MVEVMWTMAMGEDMAMEDMDTVDMEVDTDIVDTEADMVVAMADSLEDMVEAITEWIIQVASEDAKKI